jgi:hypothetical protein
MSAFEALEAARVAGVRLSLDGDGVVVETKTPPLPAEIVEALRAVKPQVLQVLEYREVAKAAFDAEKPFGARPDAWMTAQRGLHAFIWSGWGDRAALLGWMKAELYAVPPVWARVDLCGAALLIGDRKVIAITSDTIAIKARSGSTLRFHRIGRGRLA